MFASYIIGNSSVNKKCRGKAKETKTNIDFADLVFYNEKGLPTRSSTVDSVCKMTLKWH